MYRTVLLTSSMRSCASTTYPLRVQMRSTLRTLPGITSSLSVSFHHSWQYSVDVHRLSRYRLSWLPPAKFLASWWEWQTVLEPQGLMPEAVLACSCLENVLIWTGLKARIQFNSWVWCCETEGWWSKVEGSFSMLSASHVRSSWRLANEELSWQPLN